MKKLFLLSTLVLATILGSTTKIQAQNVFYNRIDVYNGYGFNVTDFIFTYDSNDQCTNNFKVVNNLSVSTTFRFKIYFNGSWRYSGTVSLAPYGSVFFNNAFTDCNSSTDLIEINCY